MFRLVAPVALFLTFNAVRCCPPQGGGTVPGSLHKPGVPPPGGQGLYGPKGHPTEQGRPGSRGPPGSQGLPGYSRQTDESTAEFRRVLSSSSSADDIFNIFDNPDGYVTLSEWVSEGGDPDTYRNLLTRIDDNGDGKISLSEVRDSWEELRILLRGLTETEVRDIPLERTRGIPSRDGVPGGDPVRRYPVRGVVGPAGPQ